MPLNWILNDSALFVGTLKVSSVGGCQIWFFMTFDYLISVIYTIFSNIYITAQKKSIWNVFAELNSNTKIKIPKKLERVLKTYLRLLNFPTAPTSKLYFLEKSPCSKFIQWYLNYEKLYSKK